MHFSNKLLMLGFLSAALTISSISVQAMDENAKYLEYCKRERTSRISVTQFNALPFDDMRKRIEERLDDILLNKQYTYGFANEIRALLKGVSNGATSQEQLAIIMNSAERGPSLSGLFKALDLKEYLIAQFILYRAGINGNDLEKLLWLKTIVGSTVLYDAAVAGPEFFDLILNHPIFNGSAQNEGNLVRYILTPNQLDGETILHYAAAKSPYALDVAKKLVGKLLGKIDDTDTLYKFINAQVEAKYWYNWINNKSAAQIARERHFPDLELADFLDSFTQEKIDCTVKPRKGIKRCAELRKKLEAEKLKLRYTKEGISHCLEKLGDDCGF